MLGENVPIGKPIFQIKKICWANFNIMTDGEKYCTEKQFGLVCIILILLCSVINHNSLPLLLLHISSNVVLVIISKHRVDVKK